MNYIYETGNGLGAVATVPKNLVLIDITEDRDEALEILKKYIVSNITGNAYDNRYNYGIVVGKINNTTLKCVPCVRYFSIIGKEEIVRKLPFVEVYTNDTNLEVLTEATDNFSNLDIGIWWLDNGNQCSPTE
jgi:hypothetical protein